jgi:hypothetical protein
MLIQLCVQEIRPEDIDVGQDQIIHESIETFLKAEIPESLLLTLSGS